MPALPCGKRVGHELKNKNIESGLRYILKQVEDISEMDYGWMESLFN